MPDSCINPANSSVFSTNKGVIATPAFNAPSCAATVSEV